MPEHGFCFLFHVRKWLFSFSCKKIMMLLPPWALYKLLFILLDLLSVSRFLALIHHKVRLHLAKCVLTGRKLKWGRELGCQKPRQATYTQRLKVMGIILVSSRFPYCRAKNSASRSETFVENTFNASNIVIRLSELNLCCDRCPAAPILMSDHMKERASCDGNTWYIFG